MNTFTDLLFSAWQITAQSVIAGMGITAAVRLAIALLGTRLNAATRYVIWFSTLLVIAFLPVLLSVRPEQPQAVRTAPPAEFAAARASAGEEIPAVRVAPFEETAAPIEVPLTVDAAAAAVSLWILIVAFLTARLLWSYTSIRRLKASASAAPPEALARVTRLLTESAANRVPDLLTSHRVRSPMAVGYAAPAVILPDSLLLTSTAEEFDAIALHEIEHVRRYDDWTRLVQCALRVLWFFHPAVHYISRQLDFERELACDDAVLSVTGAPRSYASSLTNMLEHTEQSCHPVLASGAAFNRRQIVRRVRAILDKSRNAAPAVSPLGVVVLLMCLVGFSASFVDLPSLVSFIEDAGGPSQRISWKSDGESVWLETRGSVELGEDDHLLDGLPPGSFIRFGEGTWSRRQIDYQREATGALTVRYTENGRERPVDPNVERWANTLLLKIVRTTGFDAEQRTERLLEAGGPAAVYRELDRLGSDDARARYLTALLQSSGPSDAELARVLSAAARIRAAHTKAEFLIRTAEMCRTVAAQSALLDAVRTVATDHDRRRVLEVVAGLPGLMENASLRGSYLRAVEVMEASHEQAEVLTKLLQTGRLTPEVVADVARAAASIKADHDRSRVLAELSSGEIPAPAAGLIARAASRMEADHEKADVLIRLATLPPSPAFVSAVRSIQSDADRRRVLDAMIERSTSAASVRSAAELAATLHSDSDKAQVLVAIAQQHRPDPEVSAAVRRSAAGIASAEDYRAVIRAVEQQ